MTNNTPRVPDPIDRQTLLAMQIVAAVKKTADKDGLGFIGGVFVPSGEVYTMTNMSDKDTQFLPPNANSAHD